jgi:hypothetical protein
MGMVFYELYNTKHVGYGWDLRDYIWPNFTQSILCGMPCRILNMSETIEIIPNGSPKFLTKSTRTAWLKYISEPRKQDKTKVEKEEVKKEDRTKVEKEEVKKEDRTKVEKEEVKHWKHWASVTRDWWDSIGSTVSKSKTRVGMLENKLPMPMTILGISDPGQYCIHPPVYFGSFTEEKTRKN